MITSQIETLANGGLAEIQVLLPEHHKELGLFQSKMPLRPLYQKYLDQELTGGLVYATLRSDGELIGYWISFVAPGLHYGTTLTATMDILWIRPDHRGKDSGQLLHDTMERELRRRGVKLWWAGSKNHREIEGWLVKLGFEKAEVYLAKWLGD